MSQLGVLAVSLRRQSSTGLLVGLTDGPGGTVMARQVAYRRSHEETSPEDGEPVFVHRVWPRGAPKEDARLEEWLRGVALCRGPPRTPVVPWCLLMCRRAAAATYENDTMQRNEHAVAHDVHPPGRLPE